MVRRVDVDGSRQSRDDGSASLESFGVSLEGIIERELARGKGLRGSPVVDVVRGEVCDAAVAMLGVIPREEGSAESLGGVLSGEAGGEARVVLQGLEKRRASIVPMADRPRLVGRR